MSLRRRLILSLSILTGLALSGCAPGPLSVEGVDSTVTPADARSDPTAAQGKTVLWGGKIVSSQNLEGRTRLEVVAYPTRRRAQRPDTSSDPLGRFRAYESGYLETAEYSRGREVTIRGKVTGTEEGPIDQITYTYPTVDIEAIKLWRPREAIRREAPRFYFDVGIIRRY